MKSIARLTIGVLGAFLILSPWHSIAQTCLPSVAQSLGADPHHTVIAGGPGKGGTQLAAHDAICIQAPIPGDPSPPPYRSVTNNSMVSYFVPWNSPAEWQDFLNAVGAGHLPGVTVGACCPPDNGETICGTPIGAMNGTGNNNLGARWLGRPSAIGPDIPYFGGMNDVVGPIYACNALGAGVDYAVTYVCQSGGWVQTHSVGSCTPLDGVCGAIPAGGYVSLPIDHSTLCAPGSILQNLAGTGPWTWDCFGTLGTAHCSAPLYALVNGACGPANGTTLTTAPTAGLCSSGTISPVTQDASLSHWIWSCGGIDGGTTDYCSATNANPAGSCGSAAGMTLFTAPSLPTDLCAPGDTPTPVTISGGVWQWGCIGPGGGAMASCSATNGNAAGLCGSDNGLTLTAAPTHLCSSGTAGMVTDNGGIYWDWWCTQTGGGLNAHCLAYNAGAPSCGAANGTTIASPPPVGALCNSGTEGGFTTSPSSWTWQCTNGSGVMVSCYAMNLLAPVNGACGGANGIPVLSPPTTGFCSAGNPGGYAGSGPWNWTCAGINGGSDASCSAPLMASFDGTCGASSGTTVPNAPDVNLCATGTPSAVNGSGPWNWTCIGGGTGATASCSAALCNPCSGSVSRAISYPRSGSSGSCSASGTAGWTETDNLVTSNLSLGPVTMQWSDVFGAFSATINQGAAPWPQFCSPCYLKYAGFASAGTKISSDNGSCPPSQSAGSFILGTGAAVH